MLGSIGFFYYKEKIASIDRLCGVTMDNMAMQVKVKIMRENNLDAFFIDDAVIRVGLFDKNRKVLRSNLTTKNVDFEQINYINHTSAFFVMQLPETVQEVEYIIIEDSELSANMKHLKSFIWIMLFVASIFIAFV